MDCTSWQKGAFVKSLNIFLIIYRIADFSLGIYCQTYEDNFQPVSVVKMKNYDIEKEEGNIFDLWKICFWPLKVISVWCSTLAEFRYVLGFMSFLFIRSHEASNGMRLTSFVLTVFQRLYTYRRACNDDLAFLRSVVHCCYKSVPREFIIMIRAINMLIDHLLFRYITEAQTVARIADKVIVIKTSRRNCTVSNIYQNPSVGSTFTFSVGDKMVPAWNQIHFWTHLRLSITLI